MLGNESDPIKRDSMCIPLSALGRSVDAQIPTNARVFMTGMLGPENAGKLGYFYFLRNYLVSTRGRHLVGTGPGL